MAVVGPGVLVTVLLLTLAPPHARCDGTGLASLTQYLESFYKTFEAKLSVLESNLTASLDQKSQSSNETNARFAAVEKNLASDRKETDRRLVSMETKLQQLQEMLERSADSAARLSVLEEAVAELKATLPPRDLSSAPQSDRTFEGRKEEGDQEGNAVQCRYRYQFQFQNIPSAQALNLPAEADRRLSKLEKEVWNLQTAMDRSVQTVKKTEDDLEGRILSFGNTLETVLNSSHQCQQSARNLEEKMHVRFNAVMQKLQEANTSESELGSTGETRNTSVVERLDGLQDLLLSRLNAMDELIAFVREAMPPRVEEERRPRRTCRDHYQHGAKQSGVYTLDLGDGLPAFQVFCSMDDGNAWVAIQRRQDGTVNFRRDWETYAKGFGNLTSEFWLGNSKIHRLTKAGLVHLRVYIRDFEQKTAYAEYDNFTVGDVGTNYRLKVSGYRGNAGNSLTYNSGFGFTTYDRDNDVRSSDRNCVDQDHGGWWYRNCAWANLNGLYPDSPSRRNESYVTWYHWGRLWKPLVHVEMKLRE